MGISELAQLYYETARTIHIAAGTVALGSFWTSAAVRKGSRLHRRVGDAYLLAMVGVMLSALPLAGGSFMKGQSAAGTFLLYLVLITATGCWLAWRSIRDKSRPSHYTGPVYRGLAWLNIAAGATVFFIGLSLSSVLLAGMAVVGLISGPAMLRFAAKDGNDRRWWLYEHYSAILGCGVATHIAFLNLGLQRLIPGDFSPTAQYLAWFGPIVAAFMAGRLLDYRYGKRSRPARLAAIELGGAHAD